MVYDLTVIVLTNNRTERCVDSVKHNACAFGSVKTEILIINNGREVPNLPANVHGVPCKIIQMPHNTGAVARNVGLRESCGEFILVLDDDSYIDPGLVEAMIKAFHSDPEIGAVAFKIQNGDNEEACLLPTVFHGCACGFRRSAIERVGAYPEGYLYYGEEYDLAFRLYQEGIALCYATMPEKYAMFEMQPDAIKDIFSNCWFVTIHICGLPFCHGKLFPAP